MGNGQVSISGEKTGIKNAAQNLLGMGKKRAAAMGVDSARFDKITSRIGPASEGNRVLK